MFNDNSEELVKHLLDSIKARGIKKTCELLKVEKEGDLLNKDKYVLFIVENVCRLTNIQKSQLVIGRYFRGEQKFAIGLCVYYLYDRFSLGEIKNGLFITRSKNLLSKYKNIIYELNPKYKSDANKIIIKKQMDEEIKKYNKIEKNK